MEEFIQSVSNREWASLLWLIAIIAVINVKGPIRRSLVGVLRAFFKPVIVMPLLIAAIYAAGEIYLLHKIGWWSIANLKSTVLWIVTFAFVAMFEVVSIKDHKVGLGKIARDILTVTTVFLFITELYSFSLAIEIIAIPLVTFLAAMFEVAKLRPEHAPVSKLLGAVLSLIGLTYFGFSLSLTIEKFDETATWANALEFLIPLLLSVGFLPFLYGWRLFVAYSSTFATISIFGLDQGLAPYARWLALIYIRDDLDLLERWRKAIQSTRPSSKAELKHSLVALQALKSREASPPVVLPRDGWSPYLAMQFMTDMGHDTGYYQHSFDAEWFACSPMREICGGEIWKNNLAYYIEGHEHAATTLKLKLNINDPAHSREAEDTFLIGCIHLLEQSVSIDAVERMKLRIAGLETFSEAIPFGSVALSRDDFKGGIEGGYSRKFEIRRGERQQGLGI
ncbi:hypothetical protein [Sphingobium sp.]|uniref:hypothetical protein n=1 Tax=Sphingobium sp. TaxID=1912891 RepID=UPI003BB5BC2A